MDVLYDDYLFNVKFKYKLDNDEIEANEYIIREAYNNNVPVEEFRRHGYEDMLFRKIENYDTDVLARELKDRYWVPDLDDIDTDDLEDEILSRWDCSLVKKNTDDDYAYYISSVIKCPTKFKLHLCKILGINSFAYSDEEILNFIKEKLSKAI